MIHYHKTQLGIDALQQRQLQFELHVNAVFLVLNLGPKIFRTIWATSFKTAHCHARI